MFQVLKRDGKVADFEMAKITSAIEKAFVATKNEYSSDMEAVARLIFLSSSTIRIKGVSILRFLLCQWQKDCHFRAAAQTALQGNASAVFLDDRPAD